VLRGAQGLEADTGKPAPEALAGEAAPGKRIDGPAVCGVSGAA
jgi:hypothetical protein